MFEGIFLYSVFIWFTFYLVNYAEITSAAREFLFRILPEILIKLIKCPLCYTFWITLVGLILSSNPFVALGFLLTSPVIVLFMDLVYNSLTKYASK